MNPEGGRMITLEQKANNQIFLQVARRKTKALLRNRPYGLGMDEIRAYIENDIIAPSHPAVWGCVIRDKDFVRNGDRPSRDTRCHKRYIVVWKLR